jgi:glycosyltransferase involved in cell wall biosynthesis
VMASLSRNAILELDSSAPTADGRRAMSKLLISFATVPGRGSERGVGWEFLRAAMEHCGRSNERLFAIIDSRDEVALRVAIAGLDGVDQLTLVPVPIRGPLARRIGESKSRVSYLLWVYRARSVARQLVREHDIVLAHQVTFATASMPSALPKGIVRTIWGPIGLPTSPVYSEGKSPSFAERALVRISRVVAVRFVRGVDHVIAQNEVAAALLQTETNSVQIEPNVFVEAAERTGDFARDEFLLVVVGGLTSLKRPWVALRALADSRLVDYRLEFIGDGPLRPSLQRVADSLGLHDRITFSGQLSRDETLARISAARLLLHPSVRDGAAWAVGEAAACGVASVLFEGIGAVTTARLSDNESVVCVPTGANLEVAFSDGIIRALQWPNPTPSSRWSARRLASLLNKWWG